MTAEDVKKLLGLKPHPREGGLYVRTYEAAELLAADACGSEVLLQRASQANS
jgi:uncharacterized protein